MNSANEAPNSASVLSTGTTDSSSLASMKNSGEIKDSLPIAPIGSSSPSAGLLNSQASAGASRQAASSTSTAAPAIQVEMSPNDFRGLGMSAASLPPATNSPQLSTAPSPGVDVAPGLPASPAPFITGEIAFIDSSLPNYENLVKNVRSGVTVVVLDARRDGIAQITQALAQARNISAIHIVSFDNAAGLKLGVTQVTTNSLDLYQASFRKWAAVLTPDADVLLYGSKVGTGEVGDGFMRKFSQFTGADIAALTNPVSSANGRDWKLEKTVLEVDTATIAAQIVFQASLTSTQGTGFDRPTSGATVASSS
jgi:Domain of unknown function (DUF4347)